MQLFCSKCEKPVAVPDIGEAVDGFIYSCPECDGPLLFVGYDEADNVYQQLVTEMVLGIGGSDVTGVMGAACKCTEPCESDEICPDCCCGLVSEEHLILPGFTKDEALYLLHITDKQLGKVNNAANQLINIKTKLGGYTK